MPSQGYHHLDITRLPGGGGESCFNSVTRRVYLCNESILNSGLPSTLPNGPASVPQVDSCYFNPQLFSLGCLNPWKLWKLFTVSELKESQGPRNAEPCCQQSGPPQAEGKGPILSPQQSHLVPFTVQSLFPSCSLSDRGGK